jgi:hypothetical protein
MTQSLPPLEARRRFGRQTESEPGAPVPFHTRTVARARARISKGTKMSEPYNVGIDVSMNRLYVVILPSEQ